MFKDGEEVRGRGDGRPERMLSHHRGIQKEHCTLG